MDIQLDSFILPSRENIQNGYRFIWSNDWKYE